jgi:hypothetical protein
MNLFLLLWAETRICKQSQDFQGTNFLHLDPKVRKSVLDVWATLGVPIYKTRKKSEICTVPGVQVQRFRISFLDQLISAIKLNNKPYCTQMLVF